MANKAQAKTPVVKGPQLFGFPLRPLFEFGTKGATATTGVGHVHILGESEDQDAIATALKSELLEWQVARAFKPDREISLIAGTVGPVWIVKKRKTKEGPTDHGNLESSSLYAKMRDLAGSFVGQWESFELTDLVFHLHGLSSEEVLGTVVGIELGLYRYSHFRVGKDDKKAPSNPTFHIHGAKKADIDRGHIMGVSLNMARHLVNVPANELHPASYAASVAAAFKGVTGLKVEVWDTRRCEAEGLGLLCATGGAALHGPHLVHIRYRPPQAKKKLRPIAFVGKGVTFDSGGLDIKPPANMRLMKKDMGGSAALVGLAWWLAQSETPTSVDIYLALAENAVSAPAFRPGDVIRAKNGLRVEIGNTDAEGRLVMADAFTVAQAAAGDDAPRALIDVATLTGAVKVGLGADIAGLMSNDQDLSTKLLEAAKAWGDPAWPLPLYPGYESQLKSTVADLNNCSSSAFGGAITAGLFLKRFVGPKLPWAHLDIYAWNDGAGGPFRESGGSGQGVQALIGFLSGR
jgi:leucyl aminopeptidase